MALCALLYLTRSVSVGDFNLCALFYSLEWVEKAGTCILILLYEFPHHNFHLCWSCGEMLLRLPATVAILLPLLDKHHAQ